MKKLYLASTLALAALVLPVTVSAQAPVPFPAAPFVIKGGEGLQADPAIGGSLVALVDNPGGTSRIYYKDLAVPGGALQVIPGDWDQYDTRPVVFGHVIVFQRRMDYVVGNDLMAFDVENPSAGPVVLSPTTGFSRWWPSVGGDTVAYAQFEGASLGRGDICVSSLRDPAIPETCVTSDQLTNRFPSVSPDGNTIVWSKCPGTSCDIYIAQRDTATGVWGAPRVLADGDQSYHLPHTDGRLVAWRADVGQEHHIFYMSLDGTIPPTQVILTDDPDTSEYNVHVSGSLLSLDRVRIDGSRDVNLYDIATGTLYGLPRVAGTDRYLSDVSHDETTGAVRMVWTEYVDGEYGDVWGVQFTIAAPRYAVQPLFNQARAYKLGGVVPIRLRLLDVNGTDVSASALVLTATGLVQKDSTADPLVVEDAGNANPDSAFRYDPALPGYVFNLSTKNLAAGTWELRFRVTGDAREYSVTFDLR